MGVLTYSGDMQNSVASIKGSPSVRTLIFVAWPTAALRGLPMAKIPGESGRSSIFSRAEQNLPTKVSFAGKGQFAEPKTFCRNSISTSWHQKEVIKSTNKLERSGVIRHFNFFIFF